MARNRLSFFHLTPTLIPGGKAEILINESTELCSFGYTMEKENLIQQTADYVQSYFEQEGSGHDWWHIYRVWQMTRRIAMKEDANLFFVEMAALLHDLDDWKLTSHSNSKTVAWMNQIRLNESDHTRIQTIIDEVSFKGAEVDTTPNSPEARVVQDADRLDAMGAIGIARTFAYGGHKNRLIFDPEVQPQMHASFSDYQKSTAPTINHFYEKLLLLKDRMNTKTGQKIAKKRHQFMELYLKHFFQEWNMNEQLLTS